MDSKKGKGKGKSDSDKDLEEGVEAEESHTKKSDNTQYPKPRCSKCGSTQIHVRIRSGEIVCHHCGHINSPGERKRDHF